MQLTKNLFVLNVACGALAQISTHPPGGAGTITVSISGTEVDGCLHANGQWNVAGDCPIFGGNGVGGLASNDGYLDVTKESVIVPSVGSFDTAWVGYFIDSTASALYLSADKVNSNAGGGIIWYASEAPNSTNAVPLSGLLSNGATPVYLSWVAE